MIKIDIVKAKDITKDRLRAEREVEFKKNDLAIQNALVDGIDTSPFIERREYLKDITKVVDTLETVEELKAINV